MKKLIYTSPYFMIFEQYIEKRKTPILYIVSCTNISLGQIKWYSSWRKFCFFPNTDTIWDNNCLTFLNSFIESYNINWKNQKHK